tara:strand:- start:716 stop:1375 length:660 start_codon:yes stop_codon:yes gene_type:complete
MLDKAYHQKPDEYFESVRKEMVGFLPSDAVRVLDVGCGAGLFGEYLIEKNPKLEIWGVEFDKDAAAIADKKLEKCFPGGIEENLKNIPDNYFDCIFFNDVLEHLLDPYTVLKEIQPKLAKNGVVISSIPNIRYFRNFNELVMKKNWDYTDSGVMDRTHFRFFTYKSIRKMFEEQGYEIILHKGLNRTKSIRPFILNFFFLGFFWDILYLQFATVAKVKR